MHRFLLACLFLLTIVPASRSQTAQRPITLSVLDFGNTSLGKQAAEKLQVSFQRTPGLQVLDSELSRADARGIGYSGSLNLSVVEARDLGAAMASDFYVIGDAQTLRRSSSQSPIYFESYCSLFVVSSRTGQLVFWDRPNFQSSDEAGAVDQLSRHLANEETTRRCLVAIRRTQADESIQRALVLDTTGPLIEEAPDDETRAEAQGLRLPRPYRRLRPDYPATAAQAEAEATVDVVVDVGADGEVMQLQITRWAGFGLDEATLATVRQMHFFPAMRNGTAIPMRVLLRYNFRKPPK